MSKPYDAATKDLLELSPADWLTFLGRPAGGSVRLVDADLSTVTAQADKVMLVEDAPPWILHLELQANRDTSLPRRLLKYNALLVERHGWPVSSTVNLLRPSADGAELDGLYRDWHRLDGRECLFPYHVVRLWQMPVATILASGVGTLPLAPLAAIADDDLPPIVVRIQERLTAEVSADTAARLWTATYVLMGLRFPKALAARVLQGVVAMEESVTYQEIVRKGMAQGMAQGMTQGAVDEARRLLLSAGRKKFGPSDSPTEAAVAAITDRERLEQLFDRVFCVGSWTELFAVSD